MLRDADAGLPSDEFAEKYSVSRAWVDRLKQRRRETGEVAPRKQTRWRTPILQAQLAAASPESEPRLGLFAELRQGRLRPTWHGESHRLKAGRPDPCRTAVIAF